MPTSSRHCRLSKETRAMKKMLLLASLALFSINCATAGVDITGMPSDSIQTRKAINKAELKRNDTDIPQKADIKKSVPQKATQAEKSITVDTKPNSTLEIGLPVKDKPLTNLKKEVSIDELKAAAKKSDKVKKFDNTEKLPTVSYPYYPGGNVAIREFIRKHQRYPEECKSERLTGRVEVTMTIDWDGTPHSPRITKSSGNEYMDAEALRVADMMPGWNPAEESDDPQGIEYTIFVNFRPGR